MLRNVPKIKTKIGGGNAGHNGIDSIDKKIGKNYIPELENNILSSKLVLIIQTKEFGYAVSDTASYALILKPEYMSSTTGMLLTAFLYF